MDVVVTIISSALLRKRNILHDDQRVIKEEKEKER
jgi:hypothetical protein